MAQNDKVFLYLDYEGYLPSATLVASAESMGSKAEPVVLSGSGIGNYLLVKAGGQANYVTISDEDSSMDVKNGGTATIVTVKKNGSLNSEQNTTVQQLVIETYGIATIKGTLTDAAISGVLHLKGSGTDITISQTGSLNLSGENASLNGISSMAGYIAISGGTATSISVVYNGVIGIAGGRLEKTEFASGSTLNTAALSSNNWVLSDVCFHAGSLARFYTGTILQGIISLGIATALLGTVDASKATLNFLLTERGAGESAFISDWAKCTAGKIALTVSSTQAAGTYALADKASAYTGNATLHCGEYTAMALALGGSTVYHNSVYALSLADGTLSATVADYATEASASVLSWGDINGAVSYALELTCGKEQLALEIATRGVELLGLANGGYTWRVRNAAEDDNWQTGQAFKQTDAKEGPQELVATATEATALFFAKTDGLWNDDYFALNTLTGETARLAGKTKITDIFTGGEGASILLLDAFASSTQPSGVALFLDDIYSAAPGSAERARLANIGTIIASTGDDIIDLTSNRYDLAGNVTLLGGEGDDILWANSGNDILSGGAGNDILHGGGGNDIFCFGEGWGEDTIGQLAGWKVVLWFAEGDESKWDATTLTYADGANKVIISGVDASAIELRFGATGYENEYNTLASAGVFA